MNSHGELQGTAMKRAAGVHCMKKINISERKACKVFASDFEKSEALNVM
jgi:hypothetical protein